ncbi:MAG: cob(I)yrinic acid a,c-diamide adenosyltransferase [Acidobacteria bacterium]|nr:cob(I)yrinic acid a,c-diamide adenosyltransferase [Acidobacteriota bacterium]
MKIYTRGGDDGTTGLLGGGRVRKSDPRLAALGALDELNAALGLLRPQLSDAGGARDALGRVQRDLFHFGSLVASAGGASPSLRDRLTVPPWDPADMEADIDRLTALAPPLNAFVLPGGAPGSVWAHLARAVCRRAERNLVSLSGETFVEAGVLVYLNRLGDWLFALARAENALAGVADERWVP